MKKYLWIWVSVAILVVALCGGAVYKYYCSEESLLNIFSFCGGLASFGGIILALYQIQQNNDQIVAVRNTADATRKAVEENRDEIREFLSFSDIGHLIEAIKSSQQCLVNKDYRSSLLMMKGIKDDLIRVDSQHNESLAADGVDLKCHITDINIDITNTFNHCSLKDKDKDSYKPDVIHTHLEDIREILVKLESTIKKKKL